MLDLLATERHFADHLAPVWHALPARGKFLVDRTISRDAERLGIVHEVIDASRLRHLPPLPPEPGEGPMALVASYGDVKIGRRLGYRRFAFLEHGIGQSYFGLVANRGSASYPGGPDREDNELFLSPNEHAAERWRRAYPTASVVIVGSPKLDTLPRREPGPGPVVAISFHFSFSGVPEGMPAFAHFRAALPALARRYKLLGHAHPKFLESVDHHYKTLGIEVVREFEDVCRRADVYVCDNSSTLYEFASTGRPVVVMNPPWYRRDVEHGLRFWAAANVGVEVDRSADLVPAVTRALADPPEQKDARGAALVEVYGYRAEATERAVAALLDWMGRRATGGPVVPGQTVTVGAGEKVYV